jgi:hypothetical protein
VSAAKDDHPFAVWSVSGLRDGSCEDPMLILLTTYLNEACAKGTGLYHIRWPRPARPAPSLTLPMIAIGHAVGETSCAHPQTNQTSWSAHSDECAGTTRQCCSPDHGNAEQGVTIMNRIAANPLMITMGA